MTVATYFIKYPTQIYFSEGGEKYRVFSFFGMLNGSENCDFYRFVERVSDSAYQIIKGYKEHHIGLYYDEACRKPIDITISKDWNVIHSQHIEVRSESTDSIGVPLKMQSEG